MPDTPPTDAEYPRPPVPESIYPDKPFALRQPPQELLGGLLLALVVAGLHFWWRSHPPRQQFVLGRWVLPLQLAITAIYSFWVSARAKRTNRPKTARLMLWTGVVVATLSLAGFGLTSYLASRFERAVGPGWETQRKASPER